MNIMEYKGYHAKIEFDEKSKTLRGKIEGINDYVDFEADDISSLEVEFHSAVDDYLEFCKEVEKNPEKDTVRIANSAVSAMQTLQKEMTGEAKRVGLTSDDDVVALVKELRDETF